MAWCPWSWWTHDGPTMDPRWTHDGPTKTRIKTRIIKWLIQNLQKGLDPPDREWTSSNKIFTPTICGWLPGNMHMHRLICKMNHFLHPFPHSRWPNIAATDKSVGDQQTQWSTHQVREKRALIVKLFDYLSIRCLAAIFVRSTFGFSLVLSEGSKFKYISQDSAKADW